MSQVGHNIVVALMTIVITVTGLATPAKAGLLGGTADFTEALDLPAYSPTGPKVLQALGQVINGSTQLTELSVITNPQPWAASLTASLGNDILVLTPSSADLYQVITLNFTNIIVSGQIITGFRQIGFGAIGNSDPYTESTDFTAHTLMVSYTVNDIAGGDTIALAAGGLDTFQVETSAIPEPASLLLLSLGVGGVACRRRKVTYPL